MIRVKLLKPSKYGVVNSIVVIDNNEAFGLIDSGTAVVTKDMTVVDYKITSNEEQVDGKTNKRRNTN